MRAVGLLLALAFAIWITLKGGDFRVIYFSIVIIFIAWAVFTESEEWKEGEERVRRRRLRRRWRNPFARKPRRAGDAPVAARAAQPVRAPVADPQQRERRRRRFLRTPWGLIFLLVLIAIGLAIGFYGGMPAYLR